MKPYQGFRKGSLDVTFDIVEKEICLPNSFNLKEEEFVQVYKSFKNLSQKDLS